MSVVISPLLLWFICRSFELAVAGISKLLQYEQLEYVFMVPCSAKSYVKCRVLLSANRWSEQVPLPPAFDAPDIS